MSWRFFTSSYSLIYRDMFSPKSPAIRVCATDIKQITDTVGNLGRPSSLRSSPIGGATSTYQIPSRNNFLTRWQGWR